MINPQDLDLNSLPWLPLTEKSSFPEQPAIYFAIDANDANEASTTWLTPKMVVSTLQC